MEVNHRHTETTTRGSYREIKHGVGIEKLLRRWNVVEGVGRGTKVKEREVRRSETTFRPV